MSEWGDEQKRVDRFEATSGAQHVQVGTYPPFTLDQMLLRKALVVLSDAGVLFGLVSLGSDWVHILPEGGDRWRSYPQHMVASVRWDPQ